MGSSLSRTAIETIALPAPPCSYGIDHPNYVNVDGIATMQYIINNNKTTIIYSHGNATDIGRMHIFLSRLAKHLKVNIISYDYEGYGLSMPGTKPSEAGCVRAINKIYKYLTEKNISSNDIILYGVSIGTGPTVELASSVETETKQQFKGVVLQAPYTSVVSVISKTVAYTSENVSSLSSSLNSSSLFENPDMFLNHNKITNITSPISIIHGKKDEIIPYDHAESLCEANKTAKLVTLDDAGHNNIEELYYNQLVAVLTAYVNNNLQVANAK